MPKKAVLIMVFTVLLSAWVFNSRASAASKVRFCTEADCSSITVVFGGQPHHTSLSCSQPIGWKDVPSGHYAWSATNCGLSWSGSVDVGSSGTLTITLCPRSGGSCCATGCASDNSYNCSQCGSTTTTTTTSATTTSTSATTTTTLPSSSGALVVRDSGGTEVFKVEDNGSVYSASRLLANGATAWGSAPFVLGQDAGNRGIIITNKATSNPKNIYFGWDVGASQEYAEIFALQEGVAYKNLILNPSGGYVGIGTTSPSHPLQMGSGAYCSTGGVWTNASSREYKKDIKDLASDEAMDALKGLKPVKFSFKMNPEEQHVGFVAEDAPDMVASKDRKGMSPMDVVAVLTKVVQEQEKLIQEQRKIVQEQQNAIGELSTKVTELENRLAR